MSNNIKSDELCERCEHYADDYIKTESGHQPTIWEAYICPNIKRNTPCSYFKERYEENNG